jgi:acetoin utilization protein AcuB
VNRVSQLMSRNVITIEPTASCRDAVTVMTREKIRHLPVVGPDGVMGGIITDRDLRHHLFRPEVFSSVGAVPVEQLLSEVPVERIMSRPVVSISPDEPLDRAAHVMREHRLGSLPVVDHDRLVGILTETDLLRQIVGVDGCCPEFAAIVVSYP